MLVGHGFNEDVAFGVSDEMRMAFCVIVGEQRGAKFNWQTLQYEKAT